MHYDRILAVDEHGDVAHPVVQLLVEFDREDGPFELQPTTLSNMGRPFFRQQRRADDVDRIPFFPSQIPDEAPTSPSQSDKRNLRLTLGIDFAVTLDRPCLCRSGRRVCRSAAANGQTHSV